MKPNLFPFIIEKWNGVPEPRANFTGKTIIITGSNTGLGFEAAVLYTSLNAEKVILAVRTISKGTAAQHQIEQRTARKGVVDVWQLDMDSSNSIQSFANRVDKELSRLDVVVLNAGAAPKDYTLGSEGRELILQVNVLGPAMLGLLLLPKMKASKSSEQDTPHLVIVGSESHRWVEEKDFPDPTPYGGNLLDAMSAKPVDPSKWDSLPHSARTKLFAQYVSNSLATLARKPNGEIETIVTSVCPGATKSSLMRDFGGFPMSIALRIFDLLFNKTTEQGARAYVAASVLGPEGHGAWYKTVKLASQGDLVTSAKGKEMQQQLWGEIVDALKVKTPAVESLASEKL